MEARGQHYALAIPSVVSRVHCAEIVGRKVGLSAGLDMIMIVG
jgi:hypothetical protein